MAFLKKTEQLRTGDVFTVRSAEGPQGRYKFIGLNLTAMQSGHCLMIQNLITGEQHDVSIEWFSSREITVSKVNRTK